MRKKKNGTKSSSDDFEMKSLTQDEMNSKIKSIFGNTELDMAQSLTQLSVRKVKIKKQKTPTKD